MTGTLEPVIHKQLGAAPRIFYAAPRARKNKGRLLNAGLFGFDRSSAELAHGFDSAIIQDEG